MEELDFSAVIQLQEFGVHLTTREQSDNFLAEIKRQYGFTFRNVEGYWNRRKEKTVYMVRPKEFRPLTYTDIDNARSCGYFLVEYKELLADDNEFEAFELSEFMDLIGIKM